MGGAAEDAISAHESPLSRVAGSVPGSGGVGEPDRREAWLTARGGLSHAAHPDAAAALDLNWWTCIPEEVIRPDLQGCATSMSG